MNKKHSWLSMPTFLWMFLLVGIPLIYILILSFMTRGETGKVVFTFTTDNFTRIFDPLYMKIFLRSLSIAALTTVLTLLFGYPFGYFVGRLGKRVRLLILGLMVIPFWTSSLLRTYGIMILLQTKGVINTVLQALGIIDQPLSLMYNYGAVLFGTVYMLLPFMVLPIYNAVDKLDNSVLEASRDLGAGRFKTFINITLPLTLPGIMGGVVLVFIPSIGMYFISDLLGGAKTMLLGNLIQNQIGEARNQPFAAALSVVMVVGVMLLFWLNQRVERKFTPKEAEQ